MCTNDCLNISEIKNEVVVISFILHVHVFKYTPLFLFWFQRTCVFFPLSHRYNQMPFCHLHPLRWKRSYAQGDDVIMSEKYKQRITFNSKHIVHAWKYPAVYW